MLIDTLEQLNIQISEDNRFNKKDALHVLDRAITSGRSQVHEQIFNLVNPHNQKTITVNKLKEVARLQDGCSFGELALLKNDGRAATI